jgi:hypothetical protein
MSDNSPETIHTNNRVGTAGAFMQSVDLGIDGGMAQFFQQTAPMSQHKR